MKKFRKIKAGHKSFGKKKVGDFIEVEHYIGLFDSITHAKQYSFAKEDSSYLENGYYEQKQISFDINRIGELEVVTRDGRKVLDIAALKLIYTGLCTVFQPLCDRLTLRQIPKTHTLH